MNASSQYQCHLCFDYEVPKLSQDKQDKSSGYRLTSIATLATHAHVASYGTSTTQFAVIFLQRRGEFTDSLDAHKYLSLYLRYTRTVPPCSARALSAGRH
jgi:hypothetical protein